jgi:NADH dehydrogenase
VARAVAGASVVVNCVGILFESGDQTFAAVQARGAGSVAEAAAKTGVKRLVHVSAIGADAASDSGYASAKAAGEAAVRAAFPAATIVRPSVVFGPEDDFLNRFASLSRFAPVLPLIDGGATRFQPVYVGDVADGIVRALESDAASGQTYEFGGPRVYSFKQILELVLRETGRFALLVPVPAAAAAVPAFFFELGAFWFRPMLTRDQVKLLGRDNVANTAAPGLANLGINPAPMEGIVESYLFRYRRGGTRRELSAS